MLDLVDGAVLVSGLEKWRYGNAAGRHKIHDDRLLAALRARLPALELGRLCSNDPVCADHEPEDLDERFLEGAACHGCLYIAENSCERFNRYLDRALVVPTLGNDPALAFFRR